MAEDSDDDVDLPEGFGEGDMFVGPFYNRKEMEQEVAQAVQAQRERDAGIVRSNMWADSGSSPESRSANILLEAIAREIGGERQ
jgi:hypothetical protein